MINKVRKRIRLNSLPSILTSYFITNKNNRPDLGSSFKIELFFDITDLNLTLEQKKSATINNLKPLKFNLSKNFFSPINNKKRHFIRLILTQINSWLKPKKCCLLINKTKINKCYPATKKNSVTKC